MTQYLDLLETFTEENLPDLDEVTLGALELFSDTVLPNIDFSRFARPLVVGSGNAAVTGKLLFSDVDAIFADESSYKEKLNTIQGIDGAVLLSASGGKHAIEIAQELTKRSLPTFLLTNNSDAPAKDFLPEENVHIFPKNREPYTYNTSTYMGMILSKTGENASDILSFITSEIAPVIPQNLSEYDAYYFIVPPQFNEVREMFETKFNELFGPLVMGRIFTVEQTKHAKTVIPLDTELFVSFGEENTIFGKPENRLTIPLPADAKYASMMAIGYYCIGQLQKQLPPYYKERIGEYVQESSKSFGSTITAIVE